MYDEAVVQFVELKKYVPLVSFKVELRDVQNTDWPKMLRTMTGRMHAFEMYIRT